MSDVRKDELVRLSAKHELTPEEESRLENYFTANSTARAEWEEERALSRAVQSLPDVPVSSNFTARVLQEVELEERSAERQRVHSGWWPRLWPKLGWATAAVLLAALGLQYRATKQEKLVETLAVISQDIERTPAPSPDALQEFEVINRLRQAAAPSDEELLVALQ